MTFQKGVKRTPEQEERRIAALREALKKRDMSYKQTPEYRKKCGEGTKRSWENGVFDNRPPTPKCLPGCTCGRHSSVRDMSYTQTPEFRQSVGTGIKRNWELGRYKDRFAGKVSKQEYQIAPYLQVLGYNHSCDGSICIGKRIPDFVNEEECKVFEFFGDYWHQPQDEQQRIDYYASKGWECEVLWEHDLSQWLKNHTQVTGI